MIRNCRFPPCKTYSDVKLAGTSRLQTETLGTLKSFASCSHFLKTLSKSQVKTSILVLFSEECHKLKFCSCHNRHPTLNL